MSRLLLCQGNALHLPLQDASVHCVVTSPPYWNLREYGTAQWIGGDPACPHSPADTPGKRGVGTSTLSGGKKTTGHQREGYQGACSRCGAVRIDQQLGLERLHDCNGAFTGDACGECYICHMREVFSEVHRVLRPDGTLWCNVSDSYNAAGRNGQGYKQGTNRASAAKADLCRPSAPGLKEKDLCGIPQRLALALQADGWYWRQEIIWHKCLSGGAMVYARTQKGEMPIMVKDLVRLRPDTVQLWDGDKWNPCVAFEEQAPAADRKKMSLDRRTTKYMTGEEQPVFADIEIELRNGERIGCTRDHKWPIGALGVLVKTEDLKIGHVLKPATLPEPKTPRIPFALDDEDIGWLVGLYIAEGNRDGKAIHIASHTKERERFERCCRIAAAYDGTCTWTQGHGQASSIHIRGPILQGILDAYVSGDLAYGKHLHTRCWQRSNRFLSAILDGYLHGDGHKEGFRWKVGFCQNDALAADLRTLCSRLGYSLRLRRCSHSLGERRFPGWRGDLVFDRALRRTADTEIVAIRQSRARKFWMISLQDEPHLFALTCGVLTSNSNPMPESVLDRCTKAHEQILLFSKSPRYFWDAEAIREEGTGTGWHGSSFISDYDVATKPGLGTAPRVEVPGRNARSVWSFASEPYGGAHFATFPQALPARCIQAGTSQAGVCATCGTPYVRQVERQWFLERYDEPFRPNGVHWRYSTKPTNLSFAPACACPPATVPATVLDPFAGASTTLLVARQLGRRSIGVDLSWPYLMLSRERLSLAALHAWEHGAAAKPVTYDHLPLFGATHASR